MRMVRNISIPPAETLSLHLESCVVQRVLEVGHVLVSDELGDLLPLDSLVDAALHRGVQIFKMVEICSLLHGFP